MPDTQHPWQQDTEALREAIEKRDYKTALSLARTGIYIGGCVDPDAGETAEKYRMLEAEWKAFQLAARVFNRACSVHGLTDAEATHLIDQISLNGSEGGLDPERRAELYSYYTGRIGRMGEIVVGLEVLLGDETTYTRETGLSDIDDFNYSRGILVEFHSTGQEIFFPPWET